MRFVSLFVRIAADLRDAFKVTLCLPGSQHLGTIGISIWLHLQHGFCFLVQHYRLARGNFDKPASDFDEIDDANVWLASCVPERGLGEANRGGGVRGHRR